MNRTIITLAVAASCAFAGAAGAADAAMSKDQYKAEKDRISADYKAAKERCSPMKGNAKDICKTEAKGNEKVAKAELEQKYKPSPSHDKSARMAKADADYDLAKEKCDDLKGDAKSACVKDAKSAHSTAKDGAKAAKS